MRFQNARNTATPGPSNTRPQPVSTTQDSEDCSSLAAQNQLCSSTVEGLPTFVAKLQVAKLRPKGKGKVKVAEIGTTGESHITINESTTMSTAPRSMPKPRPITRAKGKLATVEKASTSLENIPESGVPTSDNMQNTPRGSKRGNTTQWDEAPYPKKRKTQAPKPASIPASEPAEPAIASASMSLPQSADSTSAATGIDADDVIQDEHDPARTTKRTLRKRKTAISATTIEDAGRVRVKRLRGQTRK